MTEGSRVKPPLDRTLGALAGIIVGGSFTGSIWAAGALFTFGGRPQQEFAVTTGAALFYLIVLVLSFVALIALFVPQIARKLHPVLRAFLLGVAFVLLGGMSLCNLFSVAQLSPKG